MRHVTAIIALCLVGFLLASGQGIGGKGGVGGKAGFGGGASAVAPVAFDTVANSSPQSGATGTWSHTVSGSNTALFVGVVAQSAGAATLACTYNSVSLGAALWSQVDGAGVTKSWGFVLKAPTSGANTVSCTFSGGTPSEWQGASTSWDNVNQTTPTRTPFAANDGGSGTGTATVTVTNAQSGDVVVDTAGVYVQTMSANQTVRYTVFQFGAASSSYGQQSAAATGSTVMSWTLGASTFWSIGAVALEHM